MSFAFPIDIWQGLGNCETVQVSGLIGNIYGFCEAFNIYYRLPVTILFEKTIFWLLNRGKKVVNNYLATEKGGRRRLIEVAVE